MARRLSLAVALLALAAATRAEDPCSAEAARLCPQATSGVDRLACLRAHDAQLSRACKTDLDAVVAKARSIAKGDCDGDVFRLCRDVEPGEGRVAACLKQHESELSQSCQGAFNRWRVARMELVSACSGDIGRFCRDVPEGSGRIWTCLEGKLPELTSGCRAAIEKL